MSFTHWLFDRLGLSPRRSSPRKMPARRRCCRPGLEALEDRCVMSAGALEPTFGSGGVTTPPAATDHGSAYALAVYSNAQAATAGDVVAAGYVLKGNGYTFGVARYTANGQADATFGVNGEVSTPFKSDPYAEVWAVAIQADGKIVAAGTAEPGTTASTADFALVRYNANGSLDGTFGSKGEVTTYLTGSPTTVSNDYARAMVIQPPDGKIVVAGIIVPSTGAAVSIGLARYNPNGSLDTTFGSGGTVLVSHAAIPGSLVDPTYGRTWIGNAVVQADGKILVAGYTQVTSIPNFSSYEAFVVRFSSNGTLDTSFGSRGVVALPPQQQVNISNTPLGDVALEPSGEIVVTGFNQLALLHADGSFDPTFGSGGIAPGGAGFVAIEPHGEIVTAGNVQSGAQVSLFHPNGTPDTTFGSGGTVTPFLGPYAGYVVTAFALQSDGKIDVASGFDVARLLPGAPQIGSFTANPNPVSAGSATLSVSITDDNPSSTVTQVTFYYFNSGAKATLGSSTPIQTSPGVWTATLAVNLPSGIYVLFAQAEDSYGVFGDPLALSFSVGQAV